MEFKEDDLYTNDEYLRGKTKKSAERTLLFFLALALFFVWFIYKMYNDLQDFENNVRDIELNSVAYILYETGGKWLALMFPVIILLFLVVSSFQVNSEISKGENGN